MKTKQKNAVRSQYLPNSSPVPNWLFDEALRNEDFPDAVLRLLLYLLRRTIGWDKLTEKCTRRQIMNGTGIRGNRTIDYAATVICDCLGIFNRIRGKGRRPTTFTISDLSLENYIERTNLLFWIYERDLPTMKQLKQKSCTPELLAQAQQEEQMSQQQAERKAAQKAERRLEAVAHS